MLYTQQGGGICLHSAVMPHLREGEDGIAILGCFYFDFCIARGTRDEVEGSLESRAQG